MNIFVWFIIIGILLFILPPLFKRETRTQANVIKTIITLVIMGSLVIAVIFLQLPILFAVVLMLLAYLLLHTNWYSKKGLIIIGSIILVFGGSIYFVFRGDPDYVLNLLENHPESSSLLYVKNGEQVISYQATERRPLASTVKIMMAIEYAEQATAGEIDPQEKVSLDELDRFYLRNTDGGAHPSWVNEMEEENKIEEDQVRLHEVAKGMMKYSSNANTDYLLSVLGIEQVNEQIATLGLTEHEPIYPIVSALFMPIEMRSQEIVDEEIEDEELASLLRNLTDEEYRNEAIKIHEKISNDEIQLADIEYDESLDIQRVWSDRFTGGTAQEYQDLLALIHRKEHFSEETEAYVRDLLEWPMETMDDEDHYIHYGEKGGSTAFVLNQAIYAEDDEGNTFEFILFTDDLSLWQTVKLILNHEEFKDKIFAEPEYMDKIKYRMESVDTN